MNEERFVGQTLGSIAAQSDINPKGYVIFTLRDSQDDTGKRLAQCQHVRHFLAKYPYMARCKVRIAYDYFGETILRVEAE